MRIILDGVYVSVIYLNRANVDFVTRSDEDVRVVSRSMLDM